MLLAFYKNIEEYRYSFQGQEKDDEIKGNGNSVNYKYRMHDPRLGRFLSLDPLESHYPFMSPFCFAANTPIQAIDENGEGPIVVVQSKVRSTVVKALIKKYQAGEIEFSDLHESVKSIMGQVYKQGKDIDWLNRKYEEGGLAEPRTMDIGFKDSDFDGRGQSMPYVAYKQGEIADDNLYLTLTEEKEDGTWEEKQYVIQAPERTFTKEPVANSNKTQSIFTERNVVKGAGFVLNIIGDFNPVTAAIKGVATLVTGETLQEVRLVIQTKD